MQAGCDGEFKIVLSEDQLGDRTPLITACLQFSLRHCTELTALHLLHCHCGAASRWCLHLSPLIVGFLSTSATTIAWFCLFTLATNPYRVKAVIKIAKVRDVEWGKIHKRTEILQMQACTGQQLFIYLKESIIKESTYQNETGAATWDFCLLCVFSAEACAVFCFCEGPRCLFRLLWSPRSWLISAREHTVSLATGHCLPHKETSLDQGLPRQTFVNL